MSSAAASHPRARNSPPPERSSVLRPAGNSARSLQRKNSTKPVAAAGKVLLSKEPPKPSAERETLTLAATLNSLCLHEEDGGVPSCCDEKNPKSHCVEKAAGGEGEQALFDEPECSRQEARGARSGKSSLEAQHQPKVRTNRSTEKRQLIIARSRQKHASGSPKIGRIVPEGLPVPSSPQNQKKRCGWITSQSGPAHVVYHDEEWGVPVHDDRKLFEMLVLVAAQTDVSWPTVFEKREQYRRLFAGFDPAVVAKFDEEKLQCLKANGSIMQHEGKLLGVVENAVQVLKITDEFGSFDKYLWGFMNNKSIISKYRLPTQVPVKTPKSELLSKALIKRGFRFVGPTIMYSFMQAVGMVNDHLATCFRYEECNNSQESLKCTSHPTPETPSESVNCRISHPHCN